MQAERVHREGLVETLQSPQSLLTAPWQKGSQMIGAQESVGVNMLKNPAVAGDELQGCEG